MALTPIAAAAMSDNGATEDLLLPGEMSLSKDAIVKALAKPAVWGVGDKKRAVLLSFITNRDALLARVSEASQDQWGTLEKWIPMTEKVAGQACQQCTFYGHEFLDEPNSNVAALAENPKKMVAYDQAKAEANARKCSNQQMIGVKGMVITHAPTRPMLKPIYVECHCFKQGSILQSDGSDQGSTCRINCIDPVISKMKYPCDVNGMPTCPICKCMCQAAYKICSYQAILSICLQGKIKEDSGGTALLFPSIKEKKRQVNAAHTLGDVFENLISVVLQNQLQNSLHHLLL